MVSKTQRLTTAGIGVALLLSGCFGESEPTRYDISGTVRYGDRTIRTGHILFEPDVGKGADGPPGFAHIHEGKFDTSLGGKGSIGGPQIVTIEGYGDLKPVYLADEGKEVPLPETLFRGYRTEVNLQPEQPRVDFDVPVKTGKR